MVWIPQKRIWTRQPQVPTGGTSVKCASAWNAATNIDEAIGINLAPTITNGTIERKSTPAGVGYAQTMASSFNRSGNIITNGDFTAVYCGTEGTSTAGYQYAISQSGSAGLVAIGINFNDQFVNSPGRVSLTMLQTGINRSHAYVPSITGTGNALRCYLFRKKGTTVECWIDGVKRTVTTSGGFTGSPTASGDTFRICGSSADGGAKWSGSNNDGVLLGTALIQSALADSQCALFSTVSGFNQIFAPANRPIYFDLGAVSGTHTTTGALTGDIGSISGTATHYLLHTSSGTLVGQSSQVSGIATHPHVSTGALTGQIGSISGIATHPHVSTGAITGQIGSVSGVAERSTAGAHANTGALNAGNAVVTGSATHTAVHAATGVLNGPGAIVLGSSLRLTSHTTTGVLSGVGSVITGSATGPISVERVRAFGNKAGYSKRSSSGYSRGSYSNYSVKTKSGYGT